MKNIFLSINQQIAMYSSNLNSVMFTNVLYIFYNTHVLSTDIIDSSYIQKGDVLGMSS